MWPANARKRLIGQGWPEPEAVGGIPCLALVTRFWLHLGGTSSDISEHRLHHRPDLRAAHLWGHRGARSQICQDLRPARSEIRPLRPLRVARAARGLHGVDVGPGPSRVSILVFGLVLGLARCVVHMCWAMRQVVSNITLKRHITGVDTILCNAVLAAAASHFVDPMERLASAETTGCRTPTKRLPRRRRLVRRVGRELKGQTQGNLAILL